MFLQDHSRDWFQKMRAKLMNQEIYEDERQKVQSKTKAKPLSGEETNLGPNQKLQECVGRTCVSLLDRAMARQPLGANSIARRANNRTDLEIGHPRFWALGHTLRRAGLGQHFDAALP